MVDLCYAVINKQWAAVFGTIMTVGITLSEGLRPGASKDGLVCPHCFAAASDVSGVHADNFTNGG